MKLNVNKIVFKLASIVINKLIKFKKIDIEILFYLKSLQYHPKFVTQN